MTLRLYAERRGWDLGQVTVEPSHERVSGHDVIHTRTVLTGDLDDAQRERLAEIVTKCPIHKTLLASPQIIDELEVARG
jgi:putative redox protein